MAATNLGKVCFQQHYNWIQDLPPQGNEKSMFYVLDGILLEYATKYICKNSPKLYLLTKNHVLISLDWRNRGSNE